MDGRHHPGILHGSHLLLTITSEVCVTVIPILQQGQLKFKVVTQFRVTASEGQGQGFKVTLPLSPCYHTEKAQEPRKAVWSSFYKPEQ